MGEDRAYKLENYLWQQVKLGNADALATLMRTYYTQLYSYGMKLSGNKELVKDSIQNIFTYIWWKKETLGDAQNVKSYLLASFRRELLLQLKKKRNFLQIDSELDFEPDLNFTAEEKMIQQEQNVHLSTIIVAGINSLPARQKEIIYLRFVTGLDAEAIANIMSLQPQSVYNLLSEALKRLKQKLSGKITDY